MIPVINEWENLHPLTENPVKNKLVGYGALSVEDFLKNKSSVDVSSFGLLSVPALFPHVSGRVEILFFGIDLYRDNGGYRIEDSTNTYKCLSPPIWLTIGHGFFGLSQEGRHHSASISYNPSIDSACLIKAKYLGPREPKNEGELEAFSRKEFSLV